MVIAERGFQPPLVKNVQALRAIAALMVVLVHATLPLVGVEDVLGPNDAPWLGEFNYIGLFGVDLFFAISGFIMLVTSWNHFGKPGAGVRFFARRAIRIYPPYWLALAPIVPVLLFASNRFMVAHVGQKTGFFASIFLLPNPDKFILTVAWTLVWEMFFYVVFACMLGLRRRFVPAALATWGALELLSYFTLSTSTNFYLHFFAAPIPIEFILGAFVGLIYVRGRLPAPRSLAAAAVVVTGLSWAFVCVNHIELKDPNDLARVLIFGIPAAMLVYAAVALEEGVRIAAPAFLVKIGDASYAMYLWHLAILVVLRNVVERVHLAGAFAHAAVLATTIGITIVVGMLVYRFFERPVTKRLNALLPREPADEAVRTVARTDDVALAPVSVPEPSRDDARPDPDGIAIVGMAGRFPGAADIDAFWSNLCAGVESITQFAPETLEDPADIARAATPGFVAARSVIEDVELFDAAFFGMHPREAALTDPQHRVLLECCWNALEDAGYDPSGHARRTGVVCGSSINTYFLRNVMPDRASFDRFTLDYQADSFPELVGAGSDFLATKIAYKLDLHGPAMTVQSACSTSLLAVATAATNLLNGNADMMLAGAVSITFPQRRGHVHLDGGMLSADGHCRSFDAAASGTVFGSGAGVVVLKRLADAVADGDSIYAVLRGFGVTNDGSAKIGYTAPSVEGQASAIRAAHAMAGVEPRSISYVECHGTATPLGDPIEFEALRRAFASEPEDGKFCAIGSVKGNVGHLDIAAGMSGLIKTALALKHGKIPPTLHFTEPNPHLAYDDSPFSVATQLTEWTDPARRAGVSAFGLGGTNVHLVLEAPPPSHANVPRNEEPHVLALSARSESALARARTELADFLERHPATTTADAAFTLRNGRRVFSHRATVTAATPDEAIRLLRAGARDAAAARDARRLAFVFPGQGAQYVAMGRGLYDAEPAFRDAFDRCAQALRAIDGTDIARALGYRDRAHAASADTLAATALAQPAILALEYATATLWRSLGVEPETTIGHSVGEFASAVLAGVMSIEDALYVVASRGKAMQALPPGTMLAVRLAEDALRSYVTEPVAIAAVNAPSLCVVAGPAGDVEALRATLEARDVACRPLHTSHAFHSPMMRPAVDSLRTVLASIALRPPERPYVSTVTGTWITAEEATSPAYWAGHCLEPVRFADAVETLVRDGIATFVEAGPGSALSTFVRQRADARDLVVVATLPAPDATESDARTFREAAGRLWSAGIAIDLGNVDPTPSARRVSLPTYPFERTRHWIEAPQPSPAGETHTEHVATIPTGAAPHSQELARRVSRLLEDISGLAIDERDTGVSFVELGFDSLQLGRYVRELQKAFGTTLTFRQLLGELPTIDALAAYLAERVPATAFETPAAPPHATSAAPAPAASAGATPDLAAFLREQVLATSELMQRQLRALESFASAAGAAPAAPAPAPAPAVAREPVEPPARLDAFRIRPAAGQRAGMTDAQRAHVDALVRRTVARTAKSKALTQRHRAVLADPRVAAGFRSEWKEMVYPITCDRAAGSRLWDIDGTSTSTS